MANGNVLETWQERAIYELNKAIAAIQNDDSAGASFAVENAQGILDEVNDEDDDLDEDDLEDWDDDDEDDDFDEDWDELDEDGEDEDDRLDE